MKQRMHKLKRWLIRFIQIQLFISCISLPILLAWGLPFSLMSIVGNLIFGPFLTLFLLLCSLIFFCELCHIPNGWLIFCLEHVTHLWLKIMNAGSPSWLLTLPAPPAIILAFIMITTLLIIQHKKTAPAANTITALSILLLSTGLYLHIIARPTTAQQTVVHNGRKIVIAHTHGQTVVIDEGVFNRQPDASSWIEYTLLPEITKKCGSKQIDHCILLHCNARVFDAVSHLCEKAKVKNVYLPFWKKTLNRAQIRAYAKMRHMLGKHKVNLVRTGNKPVTINLPPDSSLTIKRIGKKRLALLGYPTLQVVGIMDGKKFNMSSCQKKSQSTAKYARAGAASRPTTDNGRQKRK